MTNAEAEEAASILTEQIVKAHIRAEISKALTDQEWWDSPFAKSAIKFANPIANQMFDAIQKDIYGNLKNFGGDNAGIFSLIPQPIRLLTSGLMSAAADPLNSIVD